MYIMKNEDGFYEFDVVKQDFIPNKENPQHIEIKVKANINGEKKTNKFTFKPRQVSQGSWEQVVMRWIENKEASKQVPDLEGETLKNTGYDHSGPERSYPDRKQ